ncbi:Putative MFS-type transporter [Tolypocladium paradoxum]|uniref:MFS-type transporter n=1 Tax=Tolypocladium paradoxum TaxID=94208 RepID=A0A2S4KLD5_9HYPO|nr:Putative MFS-type transporter [Tolypocladium paradoxum]
MVPLMVPPPKYATYVAIITSVFAVSSVLGPLLGGAITDHTTWRWVFFLNGPGGALAASLLAFSIPFGFPYGESTRFFRSMVSERAWQRIDFLGAFMSLAASILLVSHYNRVVWHIPGVAVPSLPFSSYPVFYGLASSHGKDSCQNGMSSASPSFHGGLAVTDLLTGFPFMAAIINIPQRLQTVNSTTAIGAGIRLLPLLLLSPVASSLSGLLISKLKVPPLYLLILGGSLQTIGVGLFSSLDSSNLQVPSAQYGYQVYYGLGVRLQPQHDTNDGADGPVTLGSVTQIRVLGGTIGLAVCSALLVNYITAETSKFLTPDQVAAILLSSKNIALLPPEVQTQTRTVYATGYSQQMSVMLYFSIVSLFSLFLLAEKRPRMLVDTATAQISTSR